jgi:tetratricopeptide (TPR) repeat protein
VSISKGSTDKVIVQESTRFSECLLWDLQTTAYTQFGPTAWSHKGVPFYITSNPFTARRYAQVVLGFLRDCAAAKGEMALDLNEPVNILDLGAGSGRFGFLFLKHLLGWLEGHPLSKIKLRYIMTDMVEDNISSLRKHPRLKPFIEKGILDFAYYRLGDKDTPGLQLKESGLSLDRESMRNPSVVIGNYFFDTVHQDLFYTKKGKLKEGRVSLYVQDGEVSDPEDPAIIDYLQCQYSYYDIEDPDNYYPNHPDLNILLKNYTQNFGGIPFLFPSGAFEAIRFVSRLTKDRYLLLVGDQGVCTSQQVVDSGEPVISKHASFSIPVNYHALSSYFQMKEGLALTTTSPDPSFVVLAGIQGGEAKDFPETTLAYREGMDAFEPQNYWSMVNSVNENLKHTDLDHMLFLLKLGHWDVSNFHAFFDEIRKKITSADQKMKDKLAQTMHNIWDNFYSVSKEESLIILNMGVLFYEMKRYEDAMCFFEHALEIQEDNEMAKKNLLLSRAAWEKEGGGR